MRKCSNCNKLCPDTEKFCQTCGLPTSVVEETATAAEQVPVKKKKTGLILGIIGALVALAAVAAILIFPKKAKGDPMHRFFDAQENFVENKLLAKENLTVESLMCGEYKPSIQEVSTDEKENTLHAFHPAVPAECYEHVQRCSGRGLDHRPE